jgi:hypothetical protein
VEEEEEEEEAYHVMSVLSSVYSRQFGDAGLSLAPHGLVQNDPVWRFIHEFKMTSNI